MYEKAEIERSKLRGIQPGRPGLMKTMSGGEYGAVMVLLALVVLWIIEETKE